MSGMNYQTYIAWAAVLLTSASVLAITKPAYAQDAPPAAGISNGQGPAPELGEIVVTAQRRQQALSDVGLSITAVSGDTLVTRNITRAEDLSKLVPGLSVSDSGFSTPIYTLRGVGVNEPSLGASSSVAVYVDEVPLDFPVMTQGATLDLQRVEVLKGPQGTLYGQNSTGGAINYIANKPTNEFQAGITGTIGRFARGDVEGYLSGPITSTLKARIAVRGNFGDNWQHSLTRNEGIGGIENYTGRAIVDWRPTERLHVSFNANGWIDKSDTLVPQLVKVFPGTPSRVDPNLVVLNAAGTPMLGADGLVVTRPELLPRDNARLTDWDAGQHFARDDKFYQFSVRTDWTLTNQVTLTSITSFAHLDRQQNAEDDGTAVSQNLRNFQTGRIDSFAQELRLAADFSGVHWLLGANLGRDTTNDNVLQYLSNASAVQNIFGFKSTGGGIRAHQNVRNYAVFTNIDIPLFDHVTINGGVRLSHDSRRFTGCGYPLDSASTPAYSALINFFRGRARLAPIPQLAVRQCYSVYTSAAAAAKDLAGLPIYTPGVGTRELTESNVPWNIGLNWKPTSRSLVYGRVSQGYKAGNFSTLNTTDLIAYNPVVQEKLTAYELGARGSFGRALRVEGAIFQYDYVNKQLRARINVGPPFGNINAQDTIPKSRIQGAEFAATLRPIRDLTIGLSGTYLDSKIQKYIGQTVDGILQDQAGSPFNFTPKYSLNADVNYSHPITDRLEGFAGVNVAYRSKTSAVFSPPGTPQPNLALFDIRENTLVDAQLGIEAPGGKWQAFIWGKNIFNQYYWTNVVRVSDVVIRFPGMPVTYGATVAYKF